MSIHDDAPRTRDGKYTYKSQTPATFGLEGPAREDLAGLSGERETIRAQYESGREQLGELNLLASRYAARGLAETLQAKHPGAATLRISENQEGNGTYDAISLKAADGTVIRDEADGDWLAEEAPNGTYVEEFVWDLELDDDRWAAGIATVDPGGDYDFKAADIDLAAAATAPLPGETGQGGAKPLSVLLEERDSIRERREELQEQLDEVEKARSAHSLRSVATLVKERYPEAVTLRIWEDQDGRDSYEPLSIANQDGALLEITLEDDAWTWGELVPGGPTIRDLVEDLSYRDDSWAEGTGSIHGTGKRQTKMIDINLAAAVSAPPSHPSPTADTTENGPTA